MQRAKGPDHATSIWPNPIPTYGGDTVLRLPPANADNAGDADDAAELERIGQAVMELQFAAEGLSGATRDEAVITGLQALESQGIGR